MVAHTYALEVVQHLLRRHACVKVYWLAHLGVPRSAERINEEASCFPFRRLVCFPVGDKGAIDGLGFGADHTGRAVGN